MCDAAVLLPIPDFIRADRLCFSGFDAGSPEFDLDEQGRECFAIDACIVPTVQALWAKGVKTTGCCCGHGSGHGVIGLLTASDDAPKFAPPYRPGDDYERRRDESRQQSGLAPGPLRGE